MSTFADLFCGIGGFHYAAQEFDLNCTFACDSDEPCRRQYKHNFAMLPESDIRCIKPSEVPDHDILFAGFPCQPFSIIGQMRGMNDRRGTLFNEILRVIDAKRPQAVMLENVRQFASASKGQAIKAVVGGLRKLGYASTWKILNALDFGLPQKRERIIIVGFADNSIAHFEWPNSREPRMPLADILEPSPDRRHFASEHIRRKRLSKHVSAISPSIWHENKAGNVSSHPYSCALRANASYNYLLVDGVRRLTPREQLRLQGFPDTFEIVGSDSQLRKQAGNAVPVPMVRAVLKEILSAESKCARRN
ncbi:MAG: DNA (cytosine-5-)-methyltransferase [Rhodobacteraceae bacterium]|nr:DNA (cytosine-5-)-methyltransferase [Paracoccaceae bacterium]